MPDTRRIERRPSISPAVLVLVGLLSACLASCNAPAERSEGVAEPTAASDAGTAPSGERVARPGAPQGTGERRVFLTGSLEASRAEYIQVPRSPNWQVDLRWLEEDGALVNAGDPVVELDDSAFANDIEEKETNLAEQLARLHILSKPPAQPVG
jgi:multidrug efflux pump subunit AcrA (membrane-fusion protein)